MAEARNKHIDAVIEKLKESIGALNNVKKNTPPANKMKTNVTQNKEAPAGVAGSRSCQANIQWVHSLRLR